MDWKVYGSITLLLFLYLVPESKAWSGNVCQRQAISWYYREYCICRYWWGCSAWRGSWYPYYYSESFCCYGWTHNGNQDCRIPICYPTCKNGGTCINPNVCACRDAFTGPTCETPQCSYQFPCYPGECAVRSTNCTCFKGFGGTPTLTVGCRDIISDDEKPQLGRVLAILANLKRIQNAPDELKYEFVTDATNKNETEMIWSNQNQFNMLSFEFESIYMNPIGFPSNRPVYVHDYGLGIVKGSIHVNLTKIPRNDGPIRDVHLDQTYNCSGVSYMQPILNTAAKCYIRDDQFSRSLSNGDWFTVTFQAENGGFRTRYDTDRGMLLSPDMVMGRIDRKRVEFRFDFEVAIHCSEKNGTCQEKPLAIAEDITSKPIGIYWGGWSDALAGMWQYYLEVFKLSPDPYGRLIEMAPLNPIYTQFINETAPHYANYTPPEPGMYSVLLEVRDMANNSKTARRLCLYDNVSIVEIDTQHKLYVSTATNISDNLWQASPDVITVVWSGHFFNRIHRENKLLNQVLEYPIQFKNVQEDGILSSSKYVFQGMDDQEGMRSIQAITNFNGIVRFEVNVDQSDNGSLPETGWKNITPLAENYTFKESLSNGRKIKVWVRAYDAMGHSAYDFAQVKFDNTPPVVSRPLFQRNYPNGSYKYCSRFMFLANDEDSGVHTLQYNLVMNSTGEVKYTGMSLANFIPDPTLCNTDPECRCTDSKCFKLNQILDIDNCWFLTKYNILKTATVTIQVFVQNQAGMSQNFSQAVIDLDKLSGLTESSGPKNIRTSNVQTNGVRLNWELPDSCYGETDILIEVADTKYRVTKVSNFIDVIGLEEGKTYTARFSMQYRYEDLGIYAQFTFSTGKTDNSGLIGGVVGGVIGFLLIIAILVGVIIILLRRGRAPQPIQKKYNEFSVRRRERRSMAAANKSYGMDNRAMSELYLYGGMSFENEQAWHLSRDDITFESLLKQGHFANIYKATMHHGSRTQEYVVAKTLKETHTNNDLQLMKAKINFLGTKVGSHPNILKFVGAVLSDETIGPFIVHEYCENGTLKEYLDRNKNNITVELQELLFRFGLDIAKGMEFLAKKDIVHRRLAARNILLNFLNEVKITGFGPQPKEATDDGDGEVGPSEKKERIPIKWMAPECMESTAGATEKSDVWSYAVVLWEIFSLGETPYSNIRSRDLPGRLKKGERLPKPEQCDDTWYNVMKRIWNYDPKKRPTFTEIRDELDQMFVTSGDDFYYYKR
ncbi:hypothetical protein ACJMK2_023994 [Sinanodonta woodiana]|uniref:Receptor protein-tyrosine kinase n=1 Tax=Sinanodonta woodiana TaxID=1069815 RepID=A0ABD3T7I3_SINWO